MHNPDETGKEQLWIPPCWPPAPAKRSPSTLAENHCPNHFDVLDYRMAKSSTRNTIQYLRNHPALKFHRNWCGLQSLGEQHLPDRIWILVLIRARALLPEVNKLYRLDLVLGLIC
ncbi:hypothetical protein Y1Q_0017809 [Alligator mississippiensis]|uniref:Uncharacterized protein n=1 Tax=Alligator mississippiensis TaxID=8496 RepID=A0A151MJS4_ALLMI|nr:hypothetical protein Y1Q_0017809 [Alligator mississippiensis]